MSTVICNQNLNTTEIKTEEVDIKDALGRILFVAVKCRSSVPPITTATKHGYAVTENKEANKKTEDRDEVDANPIMDTSPKVGGNTNADTYTYNEKYVRRSIKNKTFSANHSERNQSGWQ